MGKTTAYINKRFNWDPLIFNGSIDGTVRSHYNYCTFTIVHLKLRYIIVNASKIKLRQSRPYKSSSTRSLFYSIFHAKALFLIFCCYVPVFSTRTQPQRLPVAERVVRTADPTVTAPVTVPVPQHVPGRLGTGRAAVPVRAQPHHQPAVQRSAGSGRPSPGFAVHAGVSAGRRGGRRHRWRWRPGWTPVQDDHRRTGRGRRGRSGPVSPVSLGTAPPAPPVVRRLGVRDGHAGTVLVGWQHASTCAPRPPVAHQRQPTADVSPDATSTAAAAAATVVPVAFPTASSGSGQQRAQVHRENGQRTGLGFSHSGRGRNRRTSCRDSQVEI